MNFNINDSFKSDSSVLIVFKFEDSEFDEVLSNSGISNEVNSLTSRGRITGKYKECVSIDIVNDSNYEKLISIGLGEMKKLSKDRFIKAYGSAVSSMDYDKFKSLDICLDRNIRFENILNIISETTIISTYSFNKYKKENKKSTIENVNVISENKDLLIDFTDGIVTGTYVNMCRNLVNEPSNVLYPESLADYVRELSSSHDFELEIMSEDRIKELGMNAYYSVAQASQREAKLIVIRYRGNPDSEEVLGYVGKGLTYDAGGLSIKGTSSMVTMKSDMGGAAAVISAICAIAKLGLKVNVTGIIPSCENMISGTSYKPGDIIKSMNGKTIFIGNTDAEGRLTLADGICYGVRNEKVTKLVDIATLTGAAVKAFAEYVTPVVTNNSEFLQVLKDSSEEANEKIWEMPIVEEYRDMVKHYLADITNTPGSPGMITAGIFLEEFCEDLPWIHVDIAGSSWLDNNKNNYIKGGTGAGTRMLIYLAKNISR